MVVLEAVGRLVPGRHGQRPARPATSRSPTGCSSTRSTPGRPSSGAGPSPRCCAPATTAGSPGGGGPRRCAARRPPPGPDRGPGRAHGRGTGLLVDEPRASTEPTWRRLTAPTGRFADPGASRIACRVPVDRTDGPAPPPAPLPPADARQDPAMNATDLVDAPEPPRRRPRLRARRHPEGARPGGRGQPRAGPGVPGRRHPPPGRRPPGDLHRPQGELRRRRRAHVPGALADHRPRSRS